MIARRANKASPELRRLIAPDCPLCCGVKGHRGEHCVLCIERAQLEPVQLRRPSC